MRVRAWKACCAAGVGQQALSPKVCWQVTARLEQVLMRLPCRGLIPEESGPRSALVCSLNMHKATEHGQLHPWTLSVFSEGQPNLAS